MKRTLALLLSAVLTLAAALPVMADDRVQTAPEPASSTTDPEAGTGASSSAASSATGSEAVEETAPDALASAEQKDAAASSDVDVLTANSLHSAAMVAENTADTLHFENLRKALEKYNANILSLQGQIKDLTSTTTSSVWDTIILLEQMEKGVNSALGSLTEDSDPALRVALQADMALLEGQSSSLKIQRDSMGDSTESAKNSLNDAINQVVKGAETLYVAIVTMEDGLDAMNRGLETLDRAVAITEKRQELGMASAYDVESIHHQRSQLQSQIETMKFQISSNKITLESMCDMELNGTVKLGALPMPTQAELDSVSYDKMLNTAMNRNVDVMNAEISYNTKTSGANKNALSAAKDNFAAKFKVVCMTIPEDSRLVTAAQETVDFQQRTFDIAAKKYELGMLSHEEYLSAKSDLDSAQDDLHTAQRNLFSAYQAYINATQYGLV